MTNIINDRKTLTEWKIQLSVAINMSSKGTDEPGIIHSTSNNKEIIIGNEADEIIQDLFFLILFYKDIKKA